MKNKMTHQMLLIVGSMLMVHCHHLQGATIQEFKTALTSYREDKSALNAQKVAGLYDEFNDKRMGAEINAAASYLKGNSSKGEQSLDINAIREQGEAIANGVLTPPSSRSASPAPEDIQAKIDAAKKIQRAWRDSRNRKLSKEQAAAAAQAALNDLKNKNTNKKVLTLADELEAAVNKRKARLDSLENAAKKLVKEGQAAGSATVTQSAQELLEQIQKDEEDDAERLNILKISAESHKVAARNILKFRAEALQKIRDMRKNFALSEITYKVPENKNVKYFDDMVTFVQAPDSDEFEVDDAPKNLWKALLAIYEGFLTEVAPDDVITDIKNIQDEKNRNGFILALRHYIDGIKQNVESLGQSIASDKALSYQQDKNELLNAQKALMAKSAEIDQKLSVLPETRKRVTFAEDVKKN